MNITLTPLMPFSQVYAIATDRSVPEITRIPGSTITDSAGIYLIYDQRIGTNAANRYEKLIYIGLAGAHGSGSSFNARLPKHVKKALGFHNQHPTNPQSGISDTALWRAYRSNHLAGTTEQNAMDIMEHWELQLMVLPNDSDAARSVIKLMEKVVALVYSVSMLGANPGLQQPLCNSSDLLRSLLGLFDDDRVAACPDRPFGVTHAPPVDLPLALNTLVADTEIMDAQFFNRLSDTARVIYTSYVEQVEAIFERAELGVNQLYIHYTDTGVRDLRVGGVEFSAPGRKNCLRVVWLPQSGQFDFYCLVNEADVDQIASVHNVYVETISVADPLSTRVRVTITNDDVVGFWLAMTAAAAHAAT